jgi:hypothetical protein
MQDREVKHPSEMTREELLDLVWQMSSSALDLAQHLESTEWLKVQYRKKCYERAIQMAWQICNAWEYERKEGNMQIAYFGGNGLEVINGDVSQLVDGTLPTSAPDEDKELDYNDFEQLYMALDGWIPSEQEIKELDNHFKYFRELTEDKVGKDHVDVKVKTLNRMAYKSEFIHDLAKASRKLLDMIDKDAWIPKTLD